jgi:hypothetical protein
MKAIFIKEIVMIKELNSYEDFKKLSLDEIDEYVDTPGKTTEQMKQFLTWIRRAKTEYLNSKLTNENCN